MNGTIESTMMKKNFKWEKNKRGNYFNIIIFDLIIIQGNDYKPIRLGYERLDIYKKIELSSF